MEISQYTWSRQTVRKRWVSFEPFTPMEFLCQSASDPTSHIENQDVQSQLDVEVDFLKVARFSLNGPGTNDFYHLQRAKFTGGIFLL